MCQQLYGKTSVIVAGGEVEHVVDGLALAVAFAEEPEPERV